MPRRKGPETPPRISRRKPALRGHAERNALALAALEENDLIEIYVGKFLRRQHVSQLRLYEYDDVAAWAWDGLLRAAELFDPQRGFKFVTYAGHWIQQAIQRGAVSAQFLRLPEFKGKGTDKSARQRQAKVYQASVYWERQEGDVGMEPADGKSEAAFERIDRDDAVECVREALRFLPPRSASILLRRCGHTLDEIAAQEGLSKERIRQICEDALGMLARRLGVAAPKESLTP